MIGLHQAMNRRPPHLDAGRAACMEFGKPVANRALMLAVAGMSANDMSRRVNSSRGRSVDEAP